VSGVSRTDRRPLTAAYVLIVGVMAAVPLWRGWDFVRHDGTVLMPDLKETLLSAMAAQHLAQWTGAWSRLGLYHPGPMWFYAAAGPLWLADDHPSGLVLAAAGVVSASLVLVAVALLKGVGVGRSLVGLVALMLAFSQLGVRGLLYPWNPTVIILPTTAGIACAAWCLARRSYVAPVATVVVASFVAQAHLGAVALGTLFIAAAAIGAWVNGDRRSRTVTAAAMAVAILVCWAPVARDQVSGTGNAGAVAKYVATGEVSNRFEPETPSRTFNLSVPASAGRLVEVTALASGNTAAWGGADFTVGLEHDVSPLSSVLFALLLALCLVGAEPGRIRPTQSDRFTTWMARLVLVCLVLEFLAAARARSEFRYYLVATSSGVGAAMWVCAALVAVRLLQRIPRCAPARPLRWATAALSLVAVLALAAYQLDTPEARFEYQDDTNEPMVSELVDLSGGKVIGIDATSPFLLDQAQRLGIALEIEGQPVASAPQLDQRFSDQQRRRHPDLVAVVTQPGEPVDGCEPLGPFLSAEICVRR